MLSDEQIIEITREFCTDFRWPSSAIDMARAIESAAQGWRDIADADIAR